VRGHRTQVDHTDVALGRLRFFLYFLEFLGHGSVASLSAPRSACRSTHRGRRDRDGATAYQWWTWLPAGPAPGR
jgi:hypothetical protein